MTGIEHTFKIVHCERRWPLPLAETSCQSQGDHSASATQPS